MMVALLLYAYTQGVFSSRKIAKACIERMDFAAVTGFQKPDFRTVGLFRRRHLVALAGLFQQVLVLCRQAGLVTLGHVALDGTKVKANASKHKAMSYDRMGKAEAEFAETVKGWLDQAEITDMGEDFRFRNRQGDELPAWVANKAERMKKIKEAKAALEKEAAEKAKNQKKDNDDDPPDPPKVDPKAQRNFTDPESRIMPTKSGFEQCYNAQAAVDAEAQVIVACDVVATSADCPQLLPMVDRVKANLGRKPRVCSADAGFCSEANLEGMEEPLPASQTDCGAGIRTDQTGHGVPPVPSQGIGQGPGRVEPGLHCPQPPEANESDRIRGKIPQKRIDFEPPRSLVEPKSRGWIHKCRLPSGEAIRSVGSRSAIQQNEPGRNGGTRAFTWSGS